MDKIISNLFLCPRHFYYVNFHLYRPYTPDRWQNLNLSNFGSLLLTIISYSSDLYLSGPKLRIELVNDRVTINRFTSWRISEPKEHDLSSCLWYPNDSFFLRYRCHFVTTYVYLPLLPRSLYITRKLEREIILFSVTVWSYIPDVRIWVTSET